MRQKKAALVGSLGLAAFLIVFALAQALPSNLPTGSYLQRFDRTVWLDPHSADYVKDDISPRQKMLADVIATLPGRSQKGLEEILGPSLDTGYFKNTGRDLIYVLGIQRDSFIAIDSESRAPIIGAPKGARFFRQVPVSRHKSLPAPFCSTIFVLRYLAQSLRTTTLTPSSAPRSKVLAPSCATVPICWET